MISDCPTEQELSGNNDDHKMNCNRLYSIVHVQCLSSKEKLETSFCTFFSGGLSSRTFAPICIDLYVKTASMLRDHSQFCSMVLNPQR